MLLSYTPDNNPNNPGDGNPPSGTDPNGEGDKPGCPYSRLSTGGLAVSFQVGVISAGVISNSNLLSPSIANLSAYCDLRFISTQYVPHSTGAPPINVMPSALK